MKNIKIYKGEKIMKKLMILALSLMLTLAACDGAAEPLVNNDDPITSTEDIPDKEIIESAERVLEWKNGLENSELLEFYKEDIENVHEITESKIIEIYYIEYDLNSDGLTDKIVIIQSPLHSGSRGNPLNILIRNQDNEFENIAFLTAMVFEDSVLTIPGSKTNGYYDIVVETNGIFVAEFIYEDGKYLPNIDGKRRIMHDIGLTYNEIMRNYFLESAQTQWFTVNYYGLKRQDSHIQYNFYGSGTYVRPCVNDVGAEKGDEIRVCGVIAKVGNLFPETTDGMTLDDFLATIGVTEYEYYYDFDGGYSWATRGIIDFRINEMYYAIDVSESEEYENYERLRNMNHSFRILVSNTDIALSNNTPLIEYLDAHDWDW